MRRYLAPLIFGLGGFAILTSLGVWQLQRLAWKEGILADIEERIAAEPVELPWQLDAARDRYLPVRIAGRTLGTEADVLISLPTRGPGFRVISAFQTDEGRLVLIDEGYVPEAEKESARPGVEMTVAGNLHWPDETDSFTPDPDTGKNIWYARDVDRLARHLGTEPVLIVVRSIEGSPERAMALPVDAPNIPNNHLGYALQWFGLAAVWVGMTLFLLWRIRNRTV